MYFKDKQTAHEIVIWKKNLVNITRLWASRGLNIIYPLVFGWYHAVYLWLLFILSIPRTSFVKVYGVSNELCPRKGRRLFFRRHSCQYPFQLVHVINTIPLNALQSFLSIKRRHTSLQVCYTTRFQRWNNRAQFIFMKERDREPSY